MELDKLAEASKKKADIAQLLADWYAKRSKDANYEPHCRSCWDKGYASVFEVTSWGTDFPGDKPGRRTRIVKKFCQLCWRGRRMEIDDAYERGIQARRPEQNN